MNTDHALPHLPPIVRIVLTQATRSLAEGSISPETFDAQVLRLTREELEPRGYHLLVRELPDGRTRFLIKAAKNGTVCEMWEHSPVQALEHSPEQEPGTPEFHPQAAVA